MDTKARLEIADRELDWAIADLAKHGRMRATNYGTQIATAIYLRALVHHLTPSGVKLPDGL